MFVLVLKLIKTKLLHRSVHSHWRLHLLHTDWLLHSHRLLHSHWLLHAHRLLHSHWLLHADRCLHAHWLLHAHRLLHSHWCLHSYRLLRKVLELFHHIYLLKVNILNITRGTRLICLSNVHFNTSRPSSRLSSWINLFLLLLLILILHLCLHLRLQSHVEVHIHSHTSHWILLTHWHLSDDLTSLYRVLQILVRIYLIFKRRCVLLCLEISELVF